MPDPNAQNISEGLRATVATIQMFSKDITFLGKSLAARIEALVSNFNSLANAVDDSKAVNEALIKGNDDYYAATQKAQDAALSEQSNAYEKFLNETLAKAQEMRATETKETQGISKKYLDYTLGMKEKELDALRSYGEKGFYVAWALHKKRLDTETAFNKKSYAVASKERGIDTLREKLTNLAQSLPGPARDIFKIAGGFENIAKMGMGASFGIIAMVEFFKQLFSFAGDAHKNVNMFAMSGGILNSTLETSYKLTPLLANGFVETADAEKAATAILGEYGMMTSKMISVIDRGNNVVRYSGMVQRQMYQDLFNTSVYLAKMGPMFGMTGDAAAKMVGSLTARFHEDIGKMGAGFEGLGRISMGLGISTTDLSNVIMKAGDQLRWFNKDGMSPVINRFTVLGIQMMDLAKKGDRFWKGLQPGEMLAIFEKITDMWSGMRPETYMALKPGAAPTDVPGLASMIQDFYTKEPVAAMREMALGLTQKLTETGMATSDAFMLMSTQPPFSDLGKAAPAALQVLTKLSETQIRESGAANDISKLADLAKQYFPDQAGNLERLREQQIVLGDPLKVIQRTIIRIFRLLVASPILGPFMRSNENLVRGANAEKWYNSLASEATQQVTKNRTGRGI